MTADSLSERHRRALLIISLSSVLVLLTDQLVKFWVVNNLPEGETVPVIGEFLQWLFVRNSGAAFSIASGSTWIFTILAASVGIVRHAFEYRAAARNGRVEARGVMRSHAKRLASFFKKYFF